MEVLATLILLSGVIDDLWTKKVHNKLIIVLFAITIITLVVFFGPYSLFSASLSFVLALAFGIPLVLVGVLGGGDMKLFAVFGLATNTSAVLGVAVYSLVWGALLGVVRALFMGRLQELLLSTSQLLWVKGNAGQEFKVPYTVALFFGWLTHLTLIQLGASPW